MVWLSEVTWRLRVYARIVFIANTLLNGEHDVKSYPNNCVYMDLWGPATKLSLGRASYMMLVADECTLRLASYFLTRKDATTILLAFTVYRAKSKRQKANWEKTKNGIQRHW